MALTTTGTITTVLGYDPDGNTLTQTVQTQAGSNPVQTAVMTATYNAADWTASMTDNGVTTSYGYDAAGQQRTESYQNGAATMTLDAEGRLTALSDGSGHTDSFAYNPDDQTTAITLPNGVSEQATYDANGCPDAEQEHAKWHGLAHLVLEHEPLTNGVYSTEQERQAEAWADTMMTYALCGMDGAAEDGPLP